MPIFPPAKFLPANVRTAADKYAELWSDAEDARTDLVDARNRLEPARQADVNEAAENIAAGIKTTPGTQHYDAAVKAVHEAETRRQAYNAALPKVDAEVRQALRDSAGEIYATAESEFQACTDAYTKTIEALAEARKDWLVSVEAFRFAIAVKTGRRDASYEQPKIDDKFAEQRKEVSTKPEILFKPRRFQGGMVHHAHLAQIWFSVFRIPSYANGNDLTVADHPDFDAAVTKMQASSGWYLDGDYLLNDESGYCVRLHRVKELPAGMAAAWALTSKNLPPTRVAGDKTARSH